MKYILTLIWLVPSAFAIAQSPDSSAFYLQKGEDAQKEHRSLVASQYFNKSIAFNASNTDARRALGNVYTEMNRYQEAIIAYEAVVKAIPEDTVSIIKLANLYFWTHKWDQAITYAKKMQAKKVGSGANYILGKSFYETEDYG